MVDESKNDKNPFGPAVRAARAGRPLEMLEALYAVGYPDGLTYRCRQEADSYGLGSADAEAAVDHALTALYRAVQDGRLHGHPAAYARAAAVRKLGKARNRIYGDGGRRKVDENGDEEDAYGGWPAGGLRQERLDSQAITVEAIEFARSVLPDLGQENVRAVMDFVIECVEQGAEVLPTHREIGEALGLTEENAKKCVQRGFRRLEERAKSSGYREADIVSLRSTQEELTNDGK